MCRRKWSFVLALVAGTLAPVQVADAMTATVKATAVRNGNQTSFNISVCICMSGEEVIAYNAAGGGGTVSLNLSEDCEVTENDFWNDDELGGVGGRLPAGVYSDGCSWPFVQGCPPSPPECFIVATIGPVPSSEYGDENPGDFQLGDLGEEEGDVPDGTSVTVTTGSLTASSTGFPNTQS